MDIWIILAGLAGFVFVSGGLIAILWITRPRSKTTPTPAPPTARGPTCPSCGQLLSPGSAACPRCHLSTPGLPVGCLFILSGSLAGCAFALQPPPRGLTIGRNLDNDLVLDAIMVSRYHAQVMVEDGQAVLYDRDSTNGTWLVDGRRVSRHVLSIGDRFQIGEVVLAYGLPNQPLPATPSYQPAPAVPILQPQTYFEGYLLLNVLGHGGMSVVYRAQAPDGAEVAIKILDATDEWTARKFIQEGNIGAALRDHPHIRVVHDLRYSQDRRPYLVMEYVEGTSLRKLMGTRLPVPHTVGIIGQACEALEFAHQRQIVHRDVKPENILIAPDGVVKVTDFGIAKLTSAVTITTDRIVGTPEYISPEQAKGEEVRPASDIYSLGIVLYELLTGQVPFPLPTTGADQDQRSAAYAVIRHHIHTAPTPPGQLNPAIAASPLEKATLKALEKDPHKRYAHALELAEALGYRPGQPSSPHNQERRPATAPGQARLVVLEGPSRGRVIPIPADNRLVLGRALLAPGDLHISRQHAILTRQDQDWWLQDTSTNGTWVNGQRVYGQVPLTGDRVIDIGEHRLQLQIQF